MCGKSTPFYIYDLSPFYQFNPWKSMTRGKKRKIKAKITIQPQVRAMTLRGINIIPSRGASIHISETAVAP